MNFLERKKRQKQQILEDLKNQGQMSEYRDNQSKFGLGKYAGKVGSAIKNKFGKQSASVISDYADNAVNGVDDLGAIGSYADNAIKNGSEQATSALSNAIAKETAEQGAQAGAKGLSKAGGKIMPAIGGVMSAKSAYDRASKGDYVGAGLDVVSGVASFIPGIGTAIALGADAINAMKDMKKNDEMKAIGKSQQAIADNQASALSNLADKKQEIKAQQQDNLADMQIQTQPDMSSMALNETLPEPDIFTPNIVEQGLNQPSSAITESLQQPEIVIPEFNQPEVVQATPEQDKTGMVANILNSVKGMAGKVDNTVDLTQDKIGGMVDKAVAKVKPGVNDFIAGYKDNRNNSLQEGDFYKNWQEQEQQPVQTTDEQGNTVLQGGTEELKKSIMARLGEMAGTTTRLASNPYVQALIAGGIYKATGGDTGESIKYGVDWAQNKAKSDYYAKALGQQPGVLGGVYGADDYNAQVNKHYKDQMVKNTADRIQAMKDNYKNQKQAKDDLLAFQKEKEKNNYNEKVRHNKAMESLSQKKIDKNLKDEETKQALNQDMLDFIDILGTGDEDLIAQAEEDMIGTYGVDVLKQLNLLNEKYFSNKK